MTLRRAGVADLALLGERWTLAILHEALAGVTRFEQFQQRLGVARSVLARRLQALVAAGCLERRQYSNLPPRLEYVLTARGRAFRLVADALADWSRGSAA